MTVQPSSTRTNPFRLGSALPTGWVLLGGLSLAAAGCSVTNRQAPDVARPPMRIAAIAERPAAIGERPAVIAEASPVTSPAEPQEFVSVQECSALIPTSVEQEGLIQAIALPEHLESWTLEDAEAIALQSHPTLRKRNAATHAARGQYVQAGLPFNPVVQYQSEEIGNENSSGLHSVRISQQFVTANKLGIAQSVATREFQKQQARLRIEELRISASVRTAFAKGLVAQSKMDLTQTIFELAKKSEAAVQDLVNAEEASRLALLQAEVETAQSRIDFENAKSLHQAALRELAAAVGDSSIAVSRLLGDLPDPKDGKPWEETLDRIAVASPEISLAGSELARARSALQLACAQVVPNVTGQVGVGYDSFSDDTFAVVGVSVPLPIRNRNQGNIQSARAEISAAAASIDETRLSIEGRLAKAIGRYEVSRQRHQRLIELVIPAAEEAYNLAATALRAGESDYLQLLTAQRTLFEKRLRVLDALGQATISAYEIDTLLVNLPF